jgi:hypothetical protein
VGGGGAYAINFVEAVHVELTYKARELGQDGVSRPPRGGREILTLLCLKWDPRMLLLNSPTLDTTKEVPSSVQAIKWADLGSLIILA